ncbi:MAG: hypothetical protein JXA97_12960 [Anaerolineales bacterium]|nr:hypothetical protein [Anaerolineales bacterium]
MTEQEFDPGDWVVHRSYGLGHIQKIEKKRIGGETLRYYRVENTNSIFWIPVDSKSLPRIRPVVTEKELKSALRQLASAPNDLPGNYKNRKRALEAAYEDGSLASACCIIRDLNGWKRKKTFNEHERRLYDTLTTRLLREWSVCSDIGVPEAHRELNELLAESLNKTSAAS